ncbi:MAG: NosD domain-containing protein [Pseudomonadota bacterium]
MAPVIIAIGAYAAGTAAAGAAVSAGIVAAGSLAAAAIAIGVTIAVSYAGNALFMGSSQDPQITMPSLPSPGEMQTQASAILTNKQSNNAPIPVIYGSRRVGGTRVFMGVSGASNEYLWIVVALCEGEISAINTVYFDDIPSTDSRFSGLFGIAKYTGTSTQAADSSLVSTFAGWTTDHKLSGVAYVRVWFKFDRNVFRAVPVITADVDGKLVYDPRTSTTGFSNNPILCLRDYLTNTIYGCRIDSAKMDDTFNNSEANHCEEMVTVAGASQERYTCDGLVDTGVIPMRNVERLLSPCRGFLVYTAGKFRTIIDRARTPESFEFNESNIVGSWKISLGGKRDRMNRVVSNFFNPARNWQPDIAPASSSTYLSQDNGILLEKTIDLPFTANYGRAKMIATIAMKQSRQSIIAQFTASSKGLLAEVGGVYPITHSTPGWTSKNFLVLGMQLKTEDKVEVTAREYDADVYDAGTISAADTAPNTDLPDMWANIMSTLSTITVSPNPFDGDFTGIEAAIAALPADGGRIYIKNGTYALSDTVALPEKNIVIEGESRDGVVIQNAAGSLAFDIYDRTTQYRIANLTIESQNTSTYTPMIRVYGTAAADNTAHVMLENLRLDINGTASGDQGVVGQTGNGKLLLRDVYVIGGGYDGIITDDIDHVQILDCMVDGADRYGIRVEDAERLTISGCTVQDVREYGISCHTNSVSYVPQGTVIGCNVAGPCRGIFVEGVVAINVIGCNVSLQTAVVSGWSAREGIMLSGRGGISRCSVRFETASLAAPVYGIYLLDNCDGKVDSCDVKIDNDEHTYTHIGIIVGTSSGGSDRNVIAGNTVDMSNNNAYEIGIQLQSGSDYNYGGGNITYNCGTSISNSGTGNNVSAQDI